MSYPSIHGKILPDGWSMHINSYFIKNKYFSHYHIHVSKDETYLTDEVWWSMVTISKVNTSAIVLFLYPRMKPTWRMKYADQRFVCQGWILDLAVLWCFDLGWILSMSSLPKYEYCLSYLSFISYLVKLCICFFAISLIWSFSSHFEDKFIKNIALFCFFY